MSIAEPTPEISTENSAAPQTVAVVGAGLGGLAAACTLAARGHAVTLFDKNDWLGGKAAQHNESGYRFDMGPTILTMPSVLKRIFGEAGRNLEDYLDLVCLDPQWRCFFDASQGGGVLDLRADVAKMKETINGFVRDFPAEGQATGTEIGGGYENFVRYAERLHKVSDRFFFWQSVGGIMDTFKADGMFNLEVLQDLLALKMGATVGGTIRSHVPDERVAQMLDHFTQYVGSAPDQSPAVLCGIASMQVNEGVWYPMGGTRAVPQALTRLAEELGVDLRPGCPVEGIGVERGRASTVTTAAGETLRFDAVVSNSDTVRTHKELLGGTKFESKFLKKRNYEAACSGVVLYLGLNKRYDHIEHHNFVFSRDHHEEFDAIYKQGIPAPDPTAYVCAPAKTEPAVAPEGGEALYILVHTPYLRPGHDWSKMLPEYRQVILDKLKRTAGMEDIEDRIVTEASLTPEGIDKRYRVLNGAIYGLASHGRFFGAFKPGNRSKDLPGLYLAGGSAHPGPGMPMALMSGWIAADACDQDAKS
ncbi:MAG: phytoene desaturase family protein [Planctomycetota bacterium]